MGIMIDRIAIAGYRSLRDIVLPLGPLTLITGPNGSGKSSLYRGLRLLADVGQGGVVRSLAAEGGLESTLWAGPEQFSRAMRAGVQPVQGTVRQRPVQLRLGFAGTDYGYAIDLGLPEPNSRLFADDPEIKVEAVWTGGKLGRSNLIAERRGPMVRVRRQDTGAWRTSFEALSGFDSMMTHCADPVDGLELLQLRERMRGWRFYDQLRTDRDAPARRPQVGTFTPILAGDGADVAAAIRTIQAIGDGEALRDTIADAFDGAAVDFGDRGALQMRQPGLLRPLGAGELSDGTLRYILLAAALLSPRPPEFMVLNEPEASLHLSLLAPLGRLMRLAAQRSQIVVVSHAEPLVSALAADGEARMIRLSKALGETVADDVEPSPWAWPER
jgi:predicted ATPase